jgi:hypothetical protein
MLSPLFAHNIYLVDLPLMVVLISLIYSATHYDQWGPILREAVRCGLRLVGFLGVVALVLFLLARL